MGNIKEEVQKLFASGKYEKKDKKGEAIKDPDGNSIIIKFNDVTDGTFGEPTENEFGDTLFGSPGDERWGFPTEDEFGDKLFGSDLATVSAAWEKLVRAKERACMKGATDEKVRKQVQIFFRTCGVAYKNNTNSCKRAPSVLPPNHPTPPHPPTRSLAVPLAPHHHDLPRRVADGHLHVDQGVHH
jgi:hypothetical protein